MLVLPIHAQEADTGARKADGPQESLSLLLPTDFATARRLDAARDYLRQARWPEAARSLQGLLDVEEDLLVPVRDGGTKAVAWVGLRTAVERLLAELPAHGRECYEALSGPRARTLLTEARRTWDQELLEEIVRRYYHTAAGAEALRLLGVYHLDRGRPRPAAVYFARLLDRVGADDLPPATRFTAAVAFRLAGDETRAARIWRQLAGQAPKGISFGGRAVPLPELEKELARHRSTAAAAQPEWPLFRGDAGRSGRGAGFLPRLEARWSQPTADEAVPREWLQMAVHQEEARPQPILPGSVPVVVGGRAIYRTANGVQAADLRTGRLLWASESEWGLDRMARELRYHAHVASWIGGYLHHNANVLFENTVLGTLSTDGTRVYAVEDLPVPPFPAHLTDTRRRGGRVPVPPLPAELRDPAHYSRLLALDVEAGRLAWEVGGRGAEGGALADAHFLGPPLPVDGRLYAVVEKDLQLRLVCLAAAEGRLLWSQALAVPAERLLLDVGRRLHAVHLAYADGLLVCPTNAGVVVGVDPIRRSLAWAYPYWEETSPDDGESQAWGRWGRQRPRYLPRLRAEWRAAAPLLHEGRLLFTAPDTAAVHCLDPRTGVLLWKASRTESDLYLAGAHGDRVLLVGRQGCRAVRLADGKPVWSVRTGEPSGQGVGAGRTYYLPLKGDWPEQPPAVAAIDLERGTILRRAVALDDELPGNLVYSGDTLLSQTVSSVMAYPRADEEKGP